MSPKSKLLTFLVMLTSGASPFSVMHQLDDLDRIFTRLHIPKTALNKFLITQNKNHLHLLVEKEEVQASLPKSVPFPCETKKGRSRGRPNSVHRLRPGDVDVIAAIGDSLVAGWGATATSLPEMFIEERGKSSVGGGEGTFREFLTLPNILKEFNPNLVGYSSGPVLAIIKEEESLNVARSATGSSDLLKMANLVINRMKSNPLINVDADWKMISIFTGHNDFCGFCQYSKDSSETLNNHRRDLIEVLRLFRRKLPRTFINLIVPINLLSVVNLGNSMLCSIVHRLECPCLFDFRQRKNRNFVYNLIKAWQRIDEEVANLEEFDFDDFAVVAQPFLENYSFPEKEDGNYDLSYMTKDCFHFTQKGHARLANELWNNVMEPVGNKSTPRDGTIIYEPVGGNGDGKTGSDPSDKLRPL